MDEICFLTSSCVQFTCANVVFKHKLCHILNRLNYQPTCCDFLLYSAQDDISQLMPPYRPASQPLTVTRAFFIKVFMFSCSKKYWRREEFQCHLLYLDLPNVTFKSKVKKGSSYRASSSFQISRIENISSRYLPKFPLSTDSLTRPIHGIARNHRKYYTKPPSYW
jgi:hypothetical protein